MRSRAWFGLLQDEEFYHRTRVNIMHIIGSLNMTSKRAIHARMKPADNDNTFSAIQLGSCAHRRCRLHDSESIVETLLEM